MSGMVVLDVVIGLIFVYLILSLMCSAIQEIFANYLGKRWKNLKAGIENLLEDPAKPELAEELYDHPLIRKLAPEGKKPSYIPSRNFTLALLDVIIKDPSSADGPLTQAKASVDNLPEGEIKKTLKALINDASNDIADVQARIETWFDDAMDRVSGWYVRHARRRLFWIALVLTFALNVDTIEVANSLWREPAMREAVVRSAEGFYENEKQRLEKKGEAADPSVVFKDLKMKLDKQGLPIGWPQFVERWDKGKTPINFFESRRYLFLQSFFGWLLTAWGVSLGAPFWFDLLGKFLNIRNAGRKPPKSQSTPTPDAGAGAGAAV